jgi:hypothetical protein
MSIIPPRISALLGFFSATKKTSRNSSATTTDWIHKILDLVVLGCSLFLQLVERFGPVSSRDYDKEYDDYHGTPAQKKRRAARNKARRFLEREGRVRKGDGKDVDHKDHNPMNNSSSNIRVRSASANRRDQ